MDASNKLFVKILSELDHVGILESLILIGGWSQILYRYHFNNPPEISGLRTADVDFLVKDPGKIDKQVNIAEIFKNCGFDEIYSNPEGYIKYAHPDFEVEFLVHEKGKSKSAPFPLKMFNTNAQRLRYLDIIERYPMEMEYHGLKVNVPQPAAFVINKLITSQRRKKDEKKEKDILTATELGKYILKDENQKGLLKKIFNSLNIRLQKKLLNIISQQSDEIYNWLRN